MNESEAPTPRTEPRPRIWPVLIVMGAALPAMLAVMVVMGLILATVGMATGAGSSRDELERWMMDLMTGASWVTILMLVPFQLIFLIAAFMPAMLSPEPFAQRLGFVRGRSSWLLWPLYILSTLFVMFVSAIAASAIFEEPSPALEEFARSIADASPGVFIALLLFISLAPGIAEEALFRGYIQRRLLQRWSPWIAIGVTSIAFAAVHLEVQHILSVLPIGIWLGVIAWRTGSIWPCVLCHIANNAVVTVIARVRGVEAYENVLGLGYFALFALSGLAFAVCIPVLVLTSRRRGGHDAAAT